MNEPTQNSIFTPDVLIVGAGMSGLFAAWRLLSNLDPTPSVTIVDKLGRTGGRLQTTFVKIISREGEGVTVHDEEGGMRFVPDGQGMPNLWRLIKELSGSGYPLDPVNFIMGDENNRYYIRGRSFTQREAEDHNIWASLYNLAPAEKGKKPSDILEKVLEEILSQNKGMKQPNSPAEWIKFRNECTFRDYDDQPVVINNWGFWSILARYGLSGECIEMLSHVMGFMGPFQEYVNAGEGLQILFDFPEPLNASFQTLANGFESLPDALESEIKKLGGHIVLEEEIESIGGEAGKYVAKGKQNYNAKKIILAIPKKPMKELIRHSPLLMTNVRFLAAVDSVKNMELTKVGLYFEERWWHEHPKINLTNGPNFTDLPLGSVYTFSQYPSDVEKDKAYNGPAALTQYTDYIRGNFWEELQGIGKKYHAKGYPSNPEGTEAASNALVLEMMKQVKLLFGLEADDPSVPMPVMSTYRVWGQGQYGYGYHQYKIKVDDRNVYPDIFNPLENVYVCNESWSPEQGWVEGALIMSDLVLAKGFGLSPYSPDNIQDMVGNPKGISI